MQALDTVRPYMESHGGNVELLGIEDGIAQAAPGGQLQVVPGVVVDARAGGAAGARGGGARPRRHGRGGDGGGGAESRRQRRSRCRSCSERAPAWHTLDDRGSPRLAGATDVGRACRWWSRTWTGRCSPTATGAPTAAGRWTAGALDGGVLGCPGCGRSYFLPQAGRSMDDDQLQLQPVPLLREAGGDQGRPVKPLDEAVAGRRKAMMVSGLRGLAKPKPPAPAGAGRRERCDLCQTTVPAGPPAHAQPLRAPDRLRLRELLGAALRRRRVPARPATARSGSRTSSCPRRSGRSSGSRSGWRSSCTRASPSCVVALYPSPAGATESELHFETWERLVG